MAGFVWRSILWWSATLATAGLLYPAQVWALEKSIAEQREENAELATRNERLYAEVRNLRSEQSAVEERARMNLGLIREDATFFLVVEN